MIKVKKSPVIVLFLSFLLAIPACEPSCKRKESETGQNEKNQALDSVSIINDVNIAKSELDSLHKRASEQFAKTNRPLSVDLDRKMRGGILRKMIDDELIRQKVLAEGIKVDRFERVEGFEKYKERMGGQKGFELFLKHQNITEEQIQKTILSELEKDKLILKLSSIEEPTEEEIKNHYKVNQKLYTQPEMVHARHILLKLDEKEPQEKADLVLKKAHQILKEASSPNTSFSDLVHKYSEGPSVKDGGDLGFFPRGRMVKSFEDLAFSAPLKTAVGPVKTDFGYHIIYVEEKTEVRSAPLEEVRERVVEFIKRNKRARKGEDLLVTLRKSAKIKIYDYSLTEEEYKNISEQNQVATHDMRTKE